MVFINGVLPLCACTCLESGKCHRQAFVSMRTTAHGIVISYCALCEWYEEYDVYKMGVRVLN